MVSVGESMQEWLVTAKKRSRGRMKTAKNRIRSWKQNCKWGRNGLKVRSGAERFDINSYNWKKDVWRARHCLKSLISSFVSMDSSYSFLHSLDPFSFSSVFFSVFAFKQQFSFCKVHLGLESRTSFTQSKNHAP